MEPPHPLSARSRGPRAAAAQEPERKRKGDPAPGAWPASGGIANCPEDLCSCEDTAAQRWWSRYTSTNTGQPEKMYFGSRYEVSREMDLDSKELMKNQLP